MKNRAVRVLSSSALWVCGALLSLPAAAVERGFYVGGYYGKSETAYHTAPFDEISRGLYGDFPIIDFSSSIDNEDASYSFFGGYRLFRHLAFEGGFVDLGEAVYRHSATLFAAGDPDADPPVPDETATFGQKFRVRSRGMMLSALGILPLSYRTELFARGGFVYSSDKVGASFSDSTGSASIGELSESNLHWVVGAGAGMTFAEIYTVRVEYQRFMDVGDDSWEKTDVDVIGLGLTVAF